MTAEAAPSPADLEAQVSSILAGTFWRESSRHKRTVFAAGKFAELFADAAKQPAPPDSHQGARLERWREDLGGLLQSPTFLFLESRWSGAAYIYNDSRDYSAIADVRRLGELLDSAALLAPRYGPGVRHHSQAIKQALAESEREGQAAVQLAVHQERMKALRWKIPLSGVAVAGIAYLWGRPLGWGVALGFLACTSVLAGWTRGESRAAEVARRCNDIGWPLRT